MGTLSASNVYFYHKSLKFQSMSNQIADILSISAIEKYEMKQREVGTVLKLFFSQNINNFPKANLKY